MERSGGSWSKHHAQALKDEKACWNEASRTLSDLNPGLPKPYYDCDGITIYHGDCREILPHLPKVDLVLTDPPYGAGYASHPVKGKYGNHRPHSWDEQTVNMSEIIIKGINSIVWGGNYYSLTPSRRWLVWIKRDAPPSLSNVELAWTTYNANAKFFDYPIAAVNAERVGHVTQKPLALMKWCINLSGDINTILDPFMGSGTTLVAAKQLHRKAIGIEIEEKYCEIAVKRLAQGVLPL
jgi:site-specific DNA-methyltransferase (adenine-specific)